MIAVTADDFTGAAEIGGIGLRHGLKVVIETEVLSYEGVELLVIATDTRSMSSSEAIKVIDTITSDLVALHPKFIYKKLDSALRGHIYDELETQMKASGLHQTLVVPGNPIFHRYVVDGIYTINNVPLNETGFANDPDFPMKSASVADIIGTKKLALNVGLKPGCALPGDGLMVADVSCEDDLTYWAGCVDCSVIPAGGSGFFNAMMQHEFGSKQPVDITSSPVGETSLYVLGSCYPKDGFFKQMILEKRLCVSVMPDDIYYNAEYQQESITSWADEIVNGLLCDKKVVVMVQHPFVNDISVSCRIKDSLGEVIKRVVDRFEPDELFVEGGSTTSAVLSCLQVTKLFPIQEFDTGIIRMKIDKYSKMCLTTKPGSYQWPEAVWK